MHHLPQLRSGGAASAFETRDVRTIVREIAAAAGEDPAYRRPLPPS